MQFECTPPASGTFTNCAWSAWQSEEQGLRTFGAGKFATGAKCRGSRCDDLSFFVCDLT